MPRPWPATCWSRSSRAASRTTSWTTPSGPAEPVISGQLTELARLVDQGHLRPQVGAVYPLAEAARAYDAKAAGGMPGRVVLQP